MKGRSSLGDVERLPVQHPRAPHCPECGRALPNFLNVIIDVPTDDTLDGCKLLGLTIVFRVQCACGQKWDLTRECG